MMTLNLQIFLGPWDALWTMQLTLYSLVIVFPVVFRAWREMVLLLTIVLGLGLLLICRKGWLYILVGVECALHFNHSLLCYI